MVLTTANQNKNNDLLPEKCYFWTGQNNKKFSGLSKLTAKRIDQFYEEQKSEEESVLEIFIHVIGNLSSTFIG